MPGFFLRVLITALGLWLAATLLDGVRIAGPLSLVLAALLLGFVNAFVRPLVVLLTLPLTLVTLGLFLFVVNAVAHREPYELGRLRLHRPERALRAARGPAWLNSRPTLARCARKSTCL